MKAREIARKLAKTDAYMRRRRERKKIEMLFAISVSGPLAARR